MTRKDQRASSDGWGVGDFLFSVFENLEGVCGLVRFVGHGLLLAGRAVFHLLTCHF